MMRMDLAAILPMSTHCGIQDAMQCRLLTQSTEQDGHMDDERLRILEGDLAKFLSRFDSCFRSSPSREHLGTYVRGQLGPLQRKSIEPIALQAGVAPRTLQQFVGAHRWNESRMRSQVRSIVASDHGNSNAVGVIDETSFEKKGKKTTGVQRQWCGHTGKIENCVQTVHLTYVARDFATIVDSDLYLPQSWTVDADRRAEAGVPENVEFRKKWEIALELLERTAHDGVDLKWITADEFYGRVPAFLSELERRGLAYVVEIPVCTWGWTARGYARGVEHRRLDELFKRGGPSWVDYHVKETTKGPAVWRVRATRFVSHGGQDRNEKWLLIAENPLKNERKYFLSNAPSTTAIETILTVAFTRWRIERNFQESKEEIGLDHFEVRTYTGMQRHLAISMVSLLFLVRASALLRSTTASKWTVPQTRLIVNTLVDQELSPDQRERQLQTNLRKVEYWQRRAEVAERCHRKRRLAELDAAGVCMSAIVRCPDWLDEP